MPSATASAPSRGAGFLAQLQSQAGALRKPVATKDASAPRLDADFFAAEIEADKHEKYYLDLGLEQWMPLVEELTPRELEVAAAVARGFTNNAVGDLLGVSVETVKTHVGNAMDKLGARDRTQMAVTAMLYGLIDPLS